MIKKYAMATTLKLTSQVIREEQDKKRKSFIQKLRKLSPDETRKIFVRAGVLKKDGSFTSRYR